MTGSQIAQAGGRAALAGSLLVCAFMYQPPARAYAADETAGGRTWDARVQGTGADGLQVRQGPSVDFPVQAVLPEGATVHVADGPRFDDAGRAWYRVTGYNRVGTSGWSCGDYLVGSPPASTETLASSGVSVAGAMTFAALVTAYTYQIPGNGAHGSITKSGTVAHWGTVAVDPSVIPLGTRLLIEGFDDVFVAEDTGGGIRGDHVEIFFLDGASALQFGVQHRNVTVLPSAPPR